MDLAILLGPFGKGRLELVWQFFEGNGGASTVFTNQARFRDISAKEGEDRRGATF